MESKRIGFDARYISDRYHGIGRYGFGLLEALSRLARERTFVVFIGKDKNTRFDWKILNNRPNIEIQAGPWPIYWPNEHIQWPRLLRHNRIALFHTPYIVAPLFAAKKIRKIITVHDLILDRYPEYIPKPWMRPYYRFLMKWGTNQADQVLAVSQSTASDLSRYYGTSAAKIRVVGEGVDKKFRPSSERERLAKIAQKYRLPRSFILTVGARRPHKNFPMLVESFARLSNRLEHDLVFAGPADNRFIDSARIEASRQNLDDRVHFLDWVPESDLPGLYNLADLVVLPSLIEGFGLPALEAMACGTLVIAANNSSFPEVIGESGILVESMCVEELAEVIENTLSNFPLRQRLGAAGIARSSRFTWDEAARQVLGIYDENLA